MMEDIRINPYLFFTYAFIILAIIVTAGYLFTMRKRKRVHYHKTERDWHKNLPGIIEKDHTVFLIGDAGAPALTHPEPNLELLKKKLDECGEKATVVFLGDNVYPVGLPEEGTTLYERAEKRLLAQLEILKDFKGNKFFLSGNHDWNKTREGGFKAMMRQQKYIDRYFGSENVFLPRDGEPGPVEVNLTEKITLILINTIWWLQRVKKPEDWLHKEEIFFKDLERLLHDNRNRHIIIAAHHPLYSKSYHGGKFNFKQHLFPLTDLKKKLYIPLPVAGSLYPAYRKYVGALEDMSHPRYKRMRKLFFKLIKPYKNLVYAAGHDHNLQYMAKDGQHHIVSGSGSKTSFVRGGGSALFTHAHKGFFKIDFYINKEVWLEAWEPHEDTHSGALAFCKRIM